MLEQLIGAQIISMDNSNIKVQKDGKIFTIEIDDDYGNCCGYNDIEANLFFDINNPTNNPIIVKIERDEDDSSDGDGANITFFGEYGPIAELNSYSSSGSGWGYGAAVTLVCKSLDINDVITVW